MSVFNNIFSKLFHIRSIGNISPSFTTNGQIYMKDNGSLYFINSSGTEYLLSSKLAVNIIDYLFTKINTTSLNDESKFLDLTEVSKNGDLTVSGNSVTLNTTGTYFISYGIYLEDTSGTTVGSSPSAQSFIVLDSLQGTSHRRYAASENYLVSNSGNVTYANMSSGIITINSQKTAQLQLTTNTGGTISFSGVDDESNRYKIPHLSIKQIFNSSFTDAKFIRSFALTSNIPSGVLSDASFIIIDSYNITNTSNIFTVTEDGFYYVQYNSEFDCTDNTITGTDPRIDTYIIKNNLDNISNPKYARNQASVITDSGNLRYSNTSSDIIELSKNDELRLQIKQTTGSNTVSFSSTTDDKKTNLVLYKLEFINEQNFVAEVSTAQTPSSGTRVVLPLTQVTSPNDITLSGNQISFADAGTYLITYNIEMEGSGILSDPTYETFFAINKSGTVTNADERYGHISERLVTYAGNLRYSTSKSVLIEISSTDYIEWFFKQTSGTTINVSSANVDQRMRVSCSRIK